MIGRERTSLVRFQSQVATFCPGSHRYTDVHRNTAGVFVREDTHPDVVLFAGPPRFVPGLCQRIPDIDLALTGRVVLQGTVAGGVGLDYPRMRCGVSTVRPVLRQDLHAGIQNRQVMTFGQRDRDGAAALGVGAGVAGPDLDIEGLARILQFGRHIDAVDARDWGLSLSTGDGPQHQQYR